MLCLRATLSAAAQQRAAVASVTLQMPARYADAMLMMLSDYYCLTAYADAATRHACCQRYYARFGNNMIYAAKRCRVLMPRCPARRMAREVAQPCYRFRCQLRCLR